MASSIAAITIPRSMDFSRATASAICSSSILLALTAAMISVSFGGIGVAPPLSLGGKAMFLGVIRLLLKLRLWCRAFCGVAFSRVRRGRRRQSEILLHLPLGGLAAPHRFRDQIVRQNQPRLRDVFHHQHDIRIVALARVVPM